MFLFLGLKGERRFRTGFFSDLPSAVGLSQMDDKRYTYSVVPSYRFPYRFSLSLRLASPNGRNERTRTEHSNREIAHRLGSKNVLGNYDQPWTYRIRVTAYVVPAGSMDPGGQSRGLEDGTSRDADLELRSQFIFYANRPTHSTKHLL